MTKNEVQSIADKLWTQYANEHNDLQTIMNYKSFCDTIHLTVITTKDKLIQHYIDKDGIKLNTKIYYSVMCKIPSNISYSKLEAKCIQRNVTCNYTNETRIVELLAENEASIRNVIVTLNIKTIN